MQHRRWLSTLLPLLISLPTGGETGLPTPAASSSSGILGRFIAGADTLPPESTAGPGAEMRVPPPDTTDRAPEFARYPVGGTQAKPARTTSPAMMLRAPTTPRDTVRPREPQVDEAGRRPGELLDLGVRFTGRGELGGAWSRFRPCDPTILYNCNPGALPLLKPDFQFGIAVDGTISDRIRIDLDYDQRREFEGANRINVYYQGKTGEVLRRVELGEVSLELPASRYLTEGAAGGNFGFKAMARLGGLDIQGLWAQQQGSLSRREFRIGGREGAESLLQEGRVTLDDADYVQGQFFFIIDPRALQAYPHIDILSLGPGAVAAALRPDPGGEIQLFRDERPSLISPEQRAQLGYFLAEGVAGDGVVRHRGRFRRLIAGEDYLLHPSGLWLMLRTPLRGEEALAIAYRTAAGTTIGTLDPELATGHTPTLHLLRGPAPLHHPGSGSWFHEMRHVYLVDRSSEIEPREMGLVITLGEGAGGVNHREVRGRPYTFLKLFGLDEEQPSESVDEGRIFQPGREAAFGVGSAFSRFGHFGGSYLVFPTLRPFADPPPLPSLGLGPGEAAAALGDYRNPVIYDDADPVRRRDGGRFRLDFRYRVRHSTVISTFNLGAFGIREGSEVLTIGGRSLRRGVDYTIDYELGQVALTDAAGLFAADPDAELRVVWEQRSFFDLAPRSLFGLRAHYPIAGRGGIDFIGLYQAEKGVLARPHLGTEPASAFLGGAVGHLEFGLGWLDRLFGLEEGGGGGEAYESALSRLRVAGEVAVSVPNPNRRGATYLDDFESGDELPLSLDQRLWRLGSRPGSTTGASGLLPDLLTPATAAPIYWQHELLDDGGRVVGPRLARDIDRQIQLAGAQRTEPVLYLTFGNGEVPAAGRWWRSITTVLSTTGRDMSRTEYLEFYAAASSARDLALIIDLGSVSEDAFYFDEEGRTEGVHPDGRRWGLGVLDEEARLAEGEIWSARLDSIGLWNQSCLGEPGRRAYRPGDPRANCTRGNGEIDTEDLDGDGILAEFDGPIFRYVVRLGPDSPWLVRDQAATGTEFSLYRIPLRGPGATPLNGAGEGSWRFIKHLRLTIAGRPGQAQIPDIALARLRLVGSRWTKRELHGIMAGLTGDQPGLGSGSAEFQVGTVSRLTDGEFYVSPPGVGDEVQDRTSLYGSASVEYNERSLRLVYRELPPDERAEVYFRFPQGPRNLLSYRGLRLWALAPGGRWGRGAAERLVVSVGSDPRNRYLYRTTLARVPSEAVLLPEAWLPEIEIDFDQWFALRAEAERIFTAREHTGPDPLVLWDADSTYGLIIEDRARAPNLAAVREIGFAIHNASGTPLSGEVWLNDLRLGGAVRAAGLAGHWEVGLDAGGVASATVSYGSRGALFHHIGGEPPRQRVREIAFHGTAELGRIVPALGLELPLTITHHRRLDDPVFLQGSDLRAEKIPGLRETGAEQTRVTLLVRPAAKGRGAGLERMTEGAWLRLGYRASAYRASGGREEGEGVDLGVGYSYRPDRREVGLLPGPIEGLIRALLPAPLESSRLVDRLINAQFRWTPVELSFSSHFDDGEERSYRFAGIVDGPGDLPREAALSPRRELENLARIQFQPFPSLAAGVTFTSGRDLLPNSRVIGGPGLREAVGAARTDFAGLDIGWERHRRVESRVEFRPFIASWIRPGIGYTAYFRGERNTAILAGLGPGDDEAAKLVRHYQADRYLTRSVTIDPALLARELRGDGSAPGDAAGSVLSRVVGALRPIEVSWNTGADSRFERQEGAPGFGYHFGLGQSPGPGIGRGEASTAHDRESIRARGGLGLPLKTRVEFGYRSSSSGAWMRGGGRYRLEERSWPDLVLTVTRLPRPGPLGGVIASGSAMLGFQVTERVGGPGPGSATGVRRAEERSIPARFSIGLRNGVSGSYNAFFGESSSFDPTGSIEQELAQHSFQVAGRIDPPEGWQESIEAPIRFALSFALQSRRQCRVPAASLGGGECVPYVDLVNRQLALTLDTIISQLNVGLQMSYNERKSFVGLRSGSSQFLLGLYGEFNFEGGRFAGGER